MIGGFGRVGGDGVFGWWGLREGGRGLWWN